MKIVDLSRWQDLRRLSYINEINLIPNFNVSQNDRGKPPINSHQSKRSVCGSLLIIIPSLLKINEFRDYTRWHFQGKTVFLKCGSKVARECLFVREVE